MSAGDYSLARDRLSRLAARWPRRGDVQFLLGTCEARLGHVNSALTAWGRVPKDSPLASRAGLNRVGLALEHGRLAVADDGLSALAGRREDLEEEAAGLADRLDLYLGRDRGIARRIERRWATARNQPTLLRTHWMLETQPFPIEATREALERMSPEAPDDDRVWLGLADLATRTGRYEEADALLKRCENKRSGDPEVALGRLAWALVSGRPEAAALASARLPAERFTPAEIAEITARVANLRGDDVAERRALEERVVFEPGDASAWGRLADLAIREGQEGKTAHARRKKSEIDRLKNEYRTLMGRVGFGDTSQYANLARTAEALGRRFEARGWWTLLARRQGNDGEVRDALSRLSRPLPSGPPTAGQTLADLIPSLRAGTQPGRPDSGPGIPKFRDVAATAGLSFVYDNDRTSMRRLPETTGGGVGLIDYDGDGWLDVYAVQGGPFPGGSAGPEGGDRLFHNKGDGTFEDRTGPSGIASMGRAYGHGVTVGDYDNDGHPDLFVTRWRAYALYRNRGDGTFEDATARAGLAGSRGWPTSAAFADLDGDGDLDLYVCHYLDWDPQSSAPCPDPDKPGRYVYCMPRAFTAEPDRVFRNDGGVFTDVTTEAGIVDKDGRGLGVVIADLDDDGRADIFVANDMSPNYLFRNLGGFRFEETGEAAGASSNGDGGYQAGMGVACGDADGDGRPDLAVTNFYGESTTLFLNLGRGLFADRSAAADIAAPSRYVLGFGASFFDANNDGLLDLATANGHVNDYSPAIPYAMPAQLYLGAGRGRFVEVSRQAGACWRIPRVGRGMAVGDVDNDGRQDVLILPQGELLACFRNLGTAGSIGAGGQAITLQLEGTASNRDGVGAIVRVTSAGRTQSTQRFGGGSFLSACDGRLHFGLGAGTGVARADIEVRWPSGKIDRHEGLAPSGYHLSEGNPTARPLKGWHR